MDRLTVVPVIPLALSDAMKTAMLATSRSAMTRRVWVVLAKYPVNCSQVVPDALARISASSRIVLVSGMPCGRRPAFGAYLRAPTGIRHATGPGPIAGAQAPRLAGLAGARSQAPRGAWRPRE